MYIVDFNPSVSRVLHAQFDKLFARVAEDEEIIINEVKKTLGMSIRSNLLAYFVNKSLIEERIYVCFFFIKEDKAQCLITKELEFLLSLSVY